MGRTDNYPDDIRQYDNDPRSPFYDEGPEEDRQEMIEQKAEELADNWEDIDEATGEYDDLRNKFMEACGELWKAKSDLETQDAAVQIRLAWAALAEQYASDQIGE